MLKFGDPQVYEPQILKPQSVSHTPDGSALTMLFGEALSLQNEQDGLASAQILTVRVPVEACDTTAVVGYLVHLRGSVTKSAGARVVLTVALGGANAMWEWPYGELPASPEEVGADAGPVGEGFFRELFSLETRPNREENPGGFYPLPPLAINMLLTAQRRTSQDVALAVVDSIDVRAVTG